MTEFTSDVAAATKHTHSQTQTLPPTMRQMNEIWIGPHGWWDNFKNEAVLPGETVWELSYVKVFTIVSLFAVSTTHPRPNNRNEVACQCRSNKLPAHLTIYLMREGYERQYMPLDFQENGKASTRSNYCPLGAFFLEKEDRTKPLFVLYVQTRLDYLRSYLLTVCGFWSCDTCVSDTHMCSW